MCVYVCTEIFGKQQASVLKRFFFFWGGWGVGRRQIKAVLNACKVFCQCLVEDQRIKDGEGQVLLSQIKTAKGLQLAAIVGNSGLADNYLSACQRNSRGSKKQRILKLIILLLNLKLCPCLRIQGFLDGKLKEIALAETESLFFGLGSYVLQPLLLFAKPL